MAQPQPRTGSRPASLAPAGPHAPPGCSPPWAARGLPVALPGVPHVRVMDAVSVRLLVQEVKHVLDGQGERTAPVHRAEQGLEQVVHELLQGALGEGRWEGVRRGERASSRRMGQKVPCLDQACLGSLSATPGCAGSTAGVGGEGPIGVSGRWEGLMGRRFPGRSSSEREPHAHLRLCPCLVGVGRGSLMEDSKCSELRRPTAGEGHRLV